MTTTPIVALDVSDVHNALLLTDELGDACSFYKVGSELFTSAGRDVVTRIRDRGCQVFLDLKFHDIPNTVRSAARAARTSVRH
ncbi:MAG: orotidine 5'-phosphate decarboxylase / HUMPS family protein [Gemmatimonadaceae bacterium]